MTLVMGIKDFGVTVGVCLVKKPRLRSPANILDDPKVLGQLFNQLQALRASTGILEVFGILTTYAGWRICWLPDNESNSAATSNERREFNTDAFVAAPKPPEIKSIPELGSPSIMEVLTRQERSDGLEDEPCVERKLYATRIFQTRDPDLLPNIGSALWKMATAKRERPTFANPSRPQLVTSTSSQLISVALLPRGFRFHLGTLTPGSVFLDGKIFLLRDLGGGREGRVWMGADENGLGLLSSSWNIISTTLGRRQILRIRKVARRKTL